MELIRPKPVLEFTVSDLLKGTPFEGFPIVSEGEEVSQLDPFDEEYSAFVIPNGGSVSVRSIDQDDRGRCSTYTIGSRIGWEGVQDEQKILDTLINGFRTKLVQDASHILAHAAKDPKLHKTFNRAEKELVRQCGSATHIFADQEICDDREMFDISSINGHIECLPGITEYAKQWLNVEGTKGRCLAIAFNKDYLNSLGKEPLLFVHGDIGRVFFEPGRVGERDSFVGTIKIGTACVNPKAVQGALIRDPA